MKSIIKMEKSVFCNIIKPIHKQLLAFLQVSWFWVTLLSENLYYYKSCLVFGFVLFQRRNRWDGLGYLCRDIVRKSWPQYVVTASVIWLLSLQNSKVEAPSIKNEIMLVALLCQSQKHMYLYGTYSYQESEFLSARIHKFKAGTCLLKRGL